MKKDKPKLYIIRKYIMATSASGAIRKDKDTAPHDVWVDDDWKTKNLASAIGYHETSSPEDDE